MSALSSIRAGQLHFVEAESGKQSLDLVLVSYLGYLIGSKPQELQFEIISNDNGFQKVADFWNNREEGIEINLRKTVAESHQKSEPDAALKQKLSSAKATRKSKNSLHI